MLIKKLTISQKSWDKENLLSPSDLDLMQRHQKHHVAASPTLAPSEPAYGFLIRRRSGSTVITLNSTIDEDGWRTTPSYRPSRSGEKDESGTTRKGEPTPSSLNRIPARLPPRSIQQMQGINVAGALRWVSVTIAAPPTHPITL
jgi:hypothetical protein